MSVQKPTLFERQTENEQDIINMHVDLCLIRLVRCFGKEVQSFDDNLQETAIERSLDFLDDYVGNFESYVRYLESRDSENETGLKIVANDS